MTTSTLFFLSWKIKGITFIPVFLLLPYLGDVIPQVLDLPFDGDLVSFSPPLHPSHAAVSDEDNAWALVPIPSFLGQHILNVVLSITL